MTLSVLPAFSAGELSPELVSSVELEKHRVGLSLCSNMIVDALGGVKNRPGTQYINAAYSATVQSRLIPFQFNVVQSYVLEFSNLKMRILKDGALVGGPAEIVSPYATADLDALEYTQSADTLYVFHPDYNIRKITRTSDTAWTITEIPDMDGPYKARVVGDSDITINLDFVSSANWKLTASSAIFGDVEVGECIRLGFPIPGEPEALHWTWYVVSSLTSDTVINANLQDETRPVYQQVVNEFFRNGTDNWQEITAAAGAGSLSYDFANKRAVLTDDGTNDAKMEQSILTFANVNHRIFFNVAALTGTTPTVTIKVGTASGLGDIYTSPAQTSTGPYIATVLPTAGVVYISFDTAGSGAGATVAIDRMEFWSVGDEPNGGTEFNTTNWRLAAWNSTHGYPERGVINEQRLQCAGNAAQPQTLWLSETGNFESFPFHTPGLVTDSFSFNPPTPQINGIRWLSLYNGLKVGTADAIWSVFASSGGVITPTDVNIKVDGAVGSLDIAPVLAGNSMIVAPRGMAAVSEITSSFETSGFVPRDVSILARHLFEDRRIVRWAFAKNPDSVIWCVLDNGQLLGFTYVKEYDIWAWHKHSTPLGEGFKDVVVIPNSSDDNLDDVYFVINRAETGATASYTLEILNKRITSQTAAFGLSASGTPNDFKFLDSALTYDVPKTISGATAADPVVITATSHGFSDGDLVRIQNVVGMIELNNNIYKVANKSTHTFELNDTDDNNINGTGFTAYLSGGEAREMVTAISGLGHLEGQTVTALADGAARESLTVASGAITLDIAASFVHVGLPYVSEIETIDLETMTDRGTTQGGLKGVTKAEVYFKDSRDAEFSTLNRSDVWSPFDFENESTGENPPDLFTGSKEIRYPSNYDKQERIKIRQTKPYPLHIKRIIPDISYGG